METMEYELPVAALIEPLAVDGHDDTPRPRMLLFAGLHDHPRGRAGNLVGWYASEDDGRAAFRELRATRSDDEGWAELVALDAGGGGRLVAWFGWPRRGRRNHPAGRDRRHLRLVVR
jgi:hypothetical protein